MGSIRTRKDTGMLFFDFRYKGVRCRELTTLPDTTRNRQRMEKVLHEIDAKISLDQFDYGSYFPNSPYLATLNKGQGRGPELIQEVAIEQAESLSPAETFSNFAEEWFEENSVSWKRSYRATLRLTLDKYLKPAFGEIEVSRITKGEILKFRSSLAKVQNGNKTGLSPDRINHIMTPMRMILDEAADRFKFTIPFTGIKPLKVPRSDVDPFTLDEVNVFLAKVRKDFLNYYTVRFFTGMRTSEIDGLKWEYVNFERRQIYIRETIVHGFEETTKTLGSSRTIEMSDLVFKALSEQLTVTGKLSKFVFCTGDKTPFSYRNISKRVWYPTLRLLGLKPRRPYQTRHTTATLWLAAGENPEWIARQMGHANTQMLFTVYSRFVPNLTRKDGSAFEKLITENITLKGETPC